eukprot:CAMPEP_0167763246 /NCGR_PEP_ID=MMETSP0110_2-20121227/13245_1 /TAXON_ID=629695 /ORGANISM="Gymnochlora sp., Strain CCMP2014" /LENGTH=446 /DNA_ID=CAMNT_0007650267 /DNA_START=1 /DNA_END=1338 /DNA_ORIENTATION=-
MLFGTRVVCQATRLAWGPLLIYISQELKLGRKQQGEILSSFAFGYIFTQVLGGMVADRYGGKPVQTLALVASAMGMLLIPVVVDYGYWALCSVYFMMGICQGPAHPGYNAMAAIWFRASERGWVSSVCEAGPVCGTLLALLIAPRVAADHGWRTSFTILGMIATLWCIVWQHFAYSYPSEMPEEEEKGELEDGGILSTAVSQLKKATMLKLNNTVGEKSKPPKPDPASPRMNGETVKTVARGPTKFPFQFFTLLPVWGVIGQHMIFNTTRYFFADWTAIYYEDNFKRMPDESGLLLTMPFGFGACVQMLISGIEGPMIKRGYTPLQVRKMTGSTGFLITCICLFLMPMAQGPYTFCFLLSILEGSLTLHACGYKANYMDLTTRYQGIFMGTGNTIASMCTFAVPLAVATCLETSGKWYGILMFLACINVIGIFVNQKFTVVKELHV